MQYQQLAPRIDERSSTSSWRVYHSATRALYQFPDEE